MLDPNEPNQPLELTFADDVQSNVVMDAEITTPNGFAAIVRFNTATNVYDLYMGCSSNDLVKVDANDFIRLLQKAIEGLPQDFIREQEALEEKLGQPGFTHIVE